jgi:hypothetical protein
MDNNGARILLSRCNLGFLLLKFYPVVKLGLREKFKNKPFIISILLIAFLIIATVPSFWRMLRFGVYTMHDFHLFRQFEFHKCVVDLQIPCRWAPDSGFEYGEPLFNFYGQLSYMFGEPIHLAGLSVINSVKILFILSLMLSAFSMFLLAKQLWRSNFAASISAMLYVYAPYRAVDVWVRGALPEALSFIFFPLILYFFNRYLASEKMRDLAGFSLFTAALITLHNLSFLMFLLPLAVWVVYSLFKSKKWYLLKNLIFATALVFLLSAFYLLPVITETKLVNLGKTVVDYYNFRAHFTTLNQLLISRIWGYEASVWGPGDNLSFSAGQIHWTLSLLLIILVLASRKLRDNLGLLVLIALGWFSLFLTHQRSAFIWEIISPFQFLQFPWRFLSISTFLFSLSAGAVVLFLKNRVAKVVVTLALILVAILTNFSFFREDIWRPISDEHQFSGGLWEEQIASAVNDFWPTFGKKIPNEKAKEKVVFLEGEGKSFSFEKTSKTVRARVLAETPAKIQLASVYFPGWTGFVDYKKVAIFPEGDLGLATLEIPEGEHQIFLKFGDTPIRTFGNILTLLGLVIAGFLIIKKPNVKKV